MLMSQSRTRRRREDNTKKGTTKNSLFSRIILNINNINIADYLIRSEVRIENKKVKKFLRISGICKSIFFGHFCTSRSQKLVSFTFLYLLMLQKQTNIRPVGADGTSNTGSITLPSSPGTAEKEESRTR